MKFSIVAITLLAAAEAAYANSPQLEDRSFRFFRNRRPKVNNAKVRTKTVTAPATCDGAAPVATTVFQTVTVDRGGNPAPEVTRTVFITDGAAPTQAPPPPPPVEEDDQEEDQQAPPPPPPGQQTVVVTQPVTVTYTTPVTVTEVRDGQTIVETQTVTATSVEQTVETLTQINTVTETTSFGINTNTQVQDTATVTDTATATATEDAGVIETGVPGGDNGGNNGGDNGGDNGGNNGGDNGGNNGGDNGGNNGGDNGGNNGGDNGGNNGGDNGGNVDPQTSFDLDPAVIQPNLALDGQPAGGANDGQVPSLTSTNNFINFCFGKTITDGKQIREGSCNPVPMGRIIAKDLIPTAKFVSPKNFGTVPANTAFDIILKVRNFQTGAFTNAQANYYAAPSQVNDQGIVIGHSHVVVELLPSLDSTEPLNPTTFAFFKGVNQAANGDGTLVTPVTAGLAPGAYRLFSINTAANHQPVLASVAQHGSMDDAIYFTVV